MTANSSTLLRKKMNRLEFHLSLKCPGLTRSYLSLILEVEINQNFTKSIKSFVATNSKIPYYDSQNIEGDTGMIVTPDGATKTEKDI